MTDITAALHELNSRYKTKLVYIGDDANGQPLYAQSVSAEGGAGSDPSTPDYVVLIPATSGGVSRYRNIDLGTTGQVVKATPGQVYSMFFFNTTASLLYVKLYNKATAPTSADTPTETYPIPAGGGVVVPSVLGVEYTLGISARASTGVADSDNTAPAANGCVAVVSFK